MTKKKATNNAATYAAMSDAELQQTIYDLGDQRTAIAEEMRLASAEQQQRESLATARRRVETLSDGERAALSQVLSTETIASGETVNSINK